MDSVYTLWNRGAPRSCFCGPKPQKNVPTGYILYPYGKAFYNHGQKRSRLSKKEQAITGTGCQNGIKKGEKEKSSAWERGAGDLTRINNLTLIESYHDGNDLSGIGLAFVYNEYFTAIYALRL